VVGNRQLRKRLHVNIAHVRKSRCNEDRQSKRASQGDI
jgi:hypothetical protein